MPKKKTTTKRAIKSRVPAPKPSALLGAESCCDRASDAINDAQELLTQALDAVQEGDDVNFERLLGSFHAHMNAAVHNALAASNKLADYRPKARRAVRNLTGAA